MRTKKYPYGYLPKIAYWQSKLDEAIKSNDHTAMGYAYGKVEYFMNRQIALQNKAA